MAITDPIAPNAAAAMMTVERVIREVTDAAMPNNPTMGMLREKGRFIYGHTHPTIKWKIKYNQPDSDVYIPNQAMSSPQENLWQEATLPIRGRYFARSIDELNKIYAGGKDSIKDFWKELLKEGPPALLRNTAQDLLTVDGNATGNSYRFHGLPSMLAVATSGSTGEINSTSFYYPGDTYAGVNTTLGAYGGSHDYFPLSATPKSCFASPILQDYNDSSLTPLPSGQTAHSWTTQWRDSMSQASTYLMQRQSKNVSVWVTTPAMWLAAKRNIELEEGIQITRGPADSLAMKLGYKSFSYEGVDVVQDQNVPDNVCYGLVLPSISFVSPMKQLVARYKDEDAATLQSARYFVTFGNWRVETPAHVIELKNRTSAS